VLDFECQKIGNITAIVGPNGSGKSNIADAIRWVTGEQSAKNLRSKKGEDVIFCGSATKSRGSYAEVSIVLADSEPFKFELNNKEHSLTEIEVSRKLYRSGESEYLLNHKKVRLTDIQQLLASLGFGQSSYTVIGQGMVDRLLFFTASERKVLFDEAAGVKQYEIKREQALRKLESTDSNLIRLGDILAELTPRVTNLRRLVKRAEGRKELEQEFADTRERYFGSLYSEYRESSDSFDKQKAELNKKVIQFNVEIAKLEDGQKETQENPFSEKRKEAERAITELSTRRDALMREVAYLTGQIEGANHHLTSSAGRKTELEREKAVLMEKIAFLGTKIVEELEALKSNENELEKLRLKKDKLSSEIVKLEEELGKLSSQISLESLAEFDKAIASIEQDKDEKGLKVEYKNFVAKLNKLFEQFRLFSRAVSGNERNEINQRLSNLRSEIMPVDEKLVSLQVSLARSGVIDNQKAEVESARRRLVGIDSELVSPAVIPENAGQMEAQNNLKTKDKELDKLEEELAKQRGGLTQIVSSERVFEQSGIQFEREKRNLSEQRSSIRNQLANLEVEIAKTTIRLEDLNGELESTGLVIEKDKRYPYLDQMEKDVLKLKIENLRRKLDTTVGVDPETEAEYGELAQRESEMSAQVEDLTKAKNDLEKVVRELDERIKKQFSEVFRHISGEFSRYFSMLFGGGNADLRLGEDEEGNFGIEISANPPGKRIKSLNVLSGGERTLTSLALLFAILSVNPSPFCVLDEVDAALDESNTLLFVKILADLARKTQFIIISHNRDTMKVAGSLYGVTMNDEHVSKLLSVHLTEALVSAK